MERRLPVWNELQMLFMDTDPEEYLRSIARACASSPYSIEALEEILFQELLPALRPNLASVAGEWRGFESEGLQELILERHRFGKSRPLIFRSYVSEWWEQLAPEIGKLRAGQGNHDGA